MPRTRKPLSAAAQAGASDGAVAALLPDGRNYSDDFIRRCHCGLTEADRAEYRDAWYEAHTETSRTFRVGKYAGTGVNPDAEADCRRIVNRLMGRAS